MESKRAPAIVTSICSALTLVQNEEEQEIPDQGIDQKAETFKVEEGLQMLDTDKRAFDLNEQFESIAFKSIEADAFDPPKRNDKKDEVFVKVNMDPHTKST